MKWIVCVIALVLLNVQSLSAGLKWESPRIELAPTPFAASADASFGFANTGQSSVTISSVKASCGCTIPKLEKMTYAPGERGQIEARFNIGDRRGTHTVSIQVAIAGQLEPELLTLMVKIPEVATITPTMLMWTREEALTPKSITVKAAGGHELRVETVTPSGSGFEARVETIREAAEYRVVVTPRNAAQPGLSVLSIAARLPGGRKTLLAYAQARGAGAGAAMSIPQLPLPSPANPAIEPSLLAWEKGEAAEPKTIVVRMSAGKPGKILRAASSTSSFSTRIETVREDAEYRVIVTPEDTREPRFALVAIETSLSGAEAQLRAYAQVRLPQK
jgi:hypothetical protein